MSTLSTEALERLVDAVACEVYEEGCVAYYGGDVGMTYWRDLPDEQKKSRQERARELILGELAPEESENA